VVGEVLDADVLGLLDERSALFVGQVAPAATCSQPITQRAPADLLT